jgi:elongation factor 1-beta
MTFPQDINSDSGLSALNEYLKDKSYIEGYEPSQADVSVFEALTAAPSKKYVHVLRWFNHISAQKNRTELSGEKKAHTAYGAVIAGVAAAAAAKEEDDIDLFGSEDEEEDAELEKLKAQRIAEYNAKKATKPVAIAKSSVVLDIKPWDDTTDLKEMEALVRQITMDGLLWGASKIVPIGYGINKLQISLVVEDLKVSMDELEEQICALEDHVQSVDTVSFNKI